MAKKDRSGKFWWEYSAPGYITLQSMKGSYDPALSSDCRCGKECFCCEFANCCVLRPWVALSSTECWGEGVLTPEGLADGDTRDPGEGEWIPFEDLVACDIYGRSYDLYEDGEDGTLDYLEELEQEKQYAKFLEASDDEEKNQNVANNLPDPGCKMSYEDDDGEQEYPWDYDPVFEALTMKLQHDHNYPKKINGYDLSLDELPIHQSKSPFITVSNRATKYEKRSCDKNGSFPNGWCGNDLYKDRRNGKKIRVSAKKLRKIAEIIGTPYVYNLPKGHQPRVFTL